MSDLLAEVDEAMRQERMEKFWHENKAYIIAFIALTILSTAAMSGYRAWDNKTKIDQTAQIIALQNNENYPANIIDDELDVRPSLRGITLLSAAAAAVEKQNDEAAAKLYKRLAEDSKIPNEFQHLGILMDARLELASNAEANKKTILENITKVANGKSAWRTHAQIDAAVLHAETNPTKAVELLNKVADTPGLPQTLYERAQKLHHVYSGQIPDKTSQEKIQTN